MSVPLLIPEPPLQLLRSLAREIGLNEAIVLQQVYYRELQSEDGWVRRTYSEWSRHDFPFWNPRTIERIFTKLRERGLLIAEEVGDVPTDRTLCYRVDLEVVPPRQSVGLEPDNLSRQSVGVSIGESREGSSPDGEDVSLSDQVGEVFEHWRSAFGMNGNAKLTPERRRKIQARLRDNYTVDRIKRAIDGCASSDFHRSRGYTDLTLICRNGSKLEEFERKPLGDELSDHQQQVADALERGPDISEAEVAQRLAAIGGAS